MQLKYRSVDYPSLNSVASVQSFSPENQVLSAPQLKQQAQQVCTRIGQSLLKFFTGSQGPIISMSGQSSYRVYDPIHCEAHHFDSETEVRAWIEQQYSR